MKYVEFCAGIGGTRAGLDAAGWECVQAVDHDPDAVHVHRLAHGDATLADVTQLTARDVPPADAWVAGFPCQPFSSSGNRLGFGHASGHVFSHLARLAADCRPPIMVLENVEGLLTNKSGHTFASVLLELTRLGYEVDWLVMDLRWFGVPQSRPRLFVIAADEGAMQPNRLEKTPDIHICMGSDLRTPFGSYLENGKFSCAVHSRGSISELVEQLQPAVGKMQYQGSRIFGSLGHAYGSEYVSLDLSAQLFPTATALGEIVAPNFSNADSIRSARYWSPKGGGGARGLHVRDEPLAHCVGTSLGGAPLFAVSKNHIKSAKDRAAFLKYSNWHREQDGLLVMRLRPERAVLLFGPYTARLSEAVAQWGGGATRKFKLVGNMVAPVCALEVAKIVDRHAASGMKFRSKSETAEGKLGSDEAVGNYAVRSGSSIFSDSEV